MRQCCTSSKVLQTWEKIGKILTSIQKDDLRAAGIVTNLRGLLKKKGRVEAQRLDLNDIVTRTVEIVGPKR